MYGPRPSQNEEKPLYAHLSEEEAKRLREQRFRAWLRRKDLHERTIEVLAALDPERASNDEKWEEVTRCLVYVEHQLRGTESSSSSKMLEDEDTQSHSRNRGSSEIKSLQGPWLEWTMKHHAFTMIPLSDDDATKLSAWARELMFQDPDQNNAWVLPSLRYAFPAKPKKPGDPVKPLSADEKLQNKWFVKRCKAFWKRISSELARSSRRPSEVAGGKEDSKDAADEHEDARAQAKEHTEKTAEDEKSRARSTAGAKGGSRSRDEVGLQRMITMLEEDEDERRSKENEAKEERHKEAKYAHEAFVRVKDATRIRVPESLPEDRTQVSHKPARFNFSLDRRVVRPKTHSAPRNTVEMMQGTGFKYVHAMPSKAGQRNKDLDDSKARLLEMGFVHKDNFRDADPDSKFSEEQFTRERITNETRVRRSELQQELAKKSAEKYEAWLLQKDLRMQALQCLELLDPPDTTDRAIEVGQALKQVDRSTFANWYEWSKGVQSRFMAQTLWDFFEPKSCDVHSATYSHVRDTFLKLLRPGVDYKLAFEKFIAKTIKAQTQDPYAEVTPEDAERLKKELKLDHKDMKVFLRSIGVVMNAPDLQVLVDAFDANGDGSVSLEEFLDFTGLQRPLHIGLANDTLQKRCVWLSTCKETGMPNAYTKTSVAKRNSSTRSITHQAESEERQRRVEMLTKLGLLNNSGKDENDYEYDSFDEDVDDNDRRDRGHNTLRDSTSSSLKTSQCRYTRWQASDRRRGLTVLKKFAAAKREEQRLQELIEGGSAPKAPKLWCADDEDPAIQGTVEALTSKLLLRWQPQDGDLVSFFVLEFGGAVGRNRPVNFRELYRDPPTMDANCALYRWVEDLEPDTTYSFRIQAINGFGASPHTFREFTTRPGRLPIPRVISQTSTSITLRWVFSEAFVKRIATLKSIFKRADKDSNGWLSREEFMALLDDKHPEMVEFLQQITKHASQQGRPAASLFDMIGADDDAQLTWEEFENYFLDVGWAEAGNLAADRTLASDTSSVVTATTPRSRATTAGKVTKYIIEKCENEFEGTYVEILRTSSGMATVKQLEPGTAYRFRVYAINGDGLRGPLSPPVAAHTLLETPASPRLHGREQTALKPSSVTLQWDDPIETGGAAAAAARTRRLLSQWTNAHESDDQGVALDLAFAHYDRDGNGTLDVAELKGLLQDLGVEPTELRLQEALEVMDQSGDGLVSFEEFSNWWHRDKVLFVIKRSEPQTAAELKTGPNNGGNPLSVTCYRGPQRRYEVRGLLPNRYYHFGVRHVTARTHSRLSTPLRIMTPPSTPAPPVLVRTSAKTAVFKVYPPECGWGKVRLEIVAVTFADDEMTWQTLYEGIEHTVTTTQLTPATSYLARAVALNEVGVASSPTETIEFTTLPRETKEPLRPSNASSTFIIECTQDIVVGDTILFTERLFVNSSGKLVEPGANSAARNLGGTTTSTHFRGDVSISSVNSRVTIASASSTQGLAGSFVGERTVAARVVRDNYRAIRKADGSLAGRRLGLEVVWQTSTTNSCKPFDLQPGAVMERAEASITQFEVYRTPWEQELLRKPLHEERKLLDAGIRSAGLDDTSASLRMSRDRPLSASRRTSRVGGTRPAR